MNKHFFSCGSNNAPGFLLPFLLLLGMPIYSGAANPPIIKNIVIVSSKPQLTIQSDGDVTNQIQSATNLSQGNWVVLTNLVVTQSPYNFLDESSPRVSQRFYRVMQP